MMRADMVTKAADAILDRTQVPTSITDVARVVLDAILPQVTTVEELEALPEGALLANPGGVFSWRARLKLLRGVSDWLDYEPADVFKVEGPLTVVWTPGGAA